MKRFSILAGILLLVLASGAAGWMVRTHAAAAPVKLDTPYSAVLLSNGSVYYGRLEGLGTPYPVLHDVYYVQVGVKPGTKESANVLLKRGREWHAPNRMLLNASHILFVEPVTQGSRVAALIAQAK